MLVAKLNVLVTEIAAGVLTFPLFNILAFDTLPILTLILRLFRHPLYELAAEPETLLFEVVVLISHITDAIFLPMPPKSSILLRSILPSIRALSVSLIVPELALVLSRPIEPLELAYAVLLAVHPASRVYDAARPCVDTLSIDLVVSKLAVVEATIWAREHSLTVLLILYVVTQVGRFVGEGLLTFPVVLLVSPFTFVGRSIWVVTYALTIKLVF